MKGIGYIKTPIGILKILSIEHLIYSISFVEEQKNNENRTDIISNCIEQLEQYFAGNRKEFDIPVKLEGTFFQQTVWELLMKIPFGKTSTYKKIANKIGNPYSVRAVGSANAKNKIPIIIPCHRVIGSKGTLTGYAGGLWRKEWLLEHEAASSQQFLDLF